MDMKTEQIRQARNHASVKWLLSKAFNDQVPENLIEPFYLDQEHHLRLKPQIIVDLGNANLYCQTLCNIYSDLNYQSFNHWAILQTLTRKGVPVVEAIDSPITETVLIQTNPLKINAHVAVIESLMRLYVKEILSGDRVKNAIQRISGSYPIFSEQSYEQILFAWVSNVCAAMEKRIKKDIEIMDKREEQFPIPEILPVLDFQNFFDGIYLALLVSYYCPKVLPWTEINFNSLSAAEDLQNISLVKDFAQKYLPYSVFHIKSEDFLYLKSSMELNIAVLLTDLYNLFELNPVPSVYFPDGESKGITLTKNGQLQESGEIQVVESNNNEMNPNKAFVVYKSRNVKTLTGANQDPKNEFSNTTEKGEHSPAGKPTNRDRPRWKSFSGRRSRGNSSSEESQLTIENFGGSQEQLDMTFHYDRSSDMKNLFTNSDDQNSFQIIDGNERNPEKQNYEAQNFELRSPKSIKNKTSQKTTTDMPIKSSNTTHNSVEQHLNTSKKDSSVISVNEADIALLQTSMHSLISDRCKNEQRSIEDASKLSAIRFKLEEKMRQIEQDKYNLEQALLQYQVELAETIIPKDIPPQSKNINSLELEKYQQNIASVNFNLKEIQKDIQKLNTQQNHLQAQHIQAQQLIQAHHIANLLNQQQFYGSQQHLATDSQNHLRHLHQNFGSSPHLPQQFNLSRSPSNDAFQQMNSINTQHINDNGQYILPQQQAVVQNSYSNMSSDSIPYYNIYDNTSQFYTNPISNLHFVYQPDRQKVLDFGLNNQKTKREYSPFGSQQIQMGSNSQNPSDSKAQNLIGESNFQMQRTASGEHSNFNMNNFKIYYDQQTNGKREQNVSAKIFNKNLENSSIESLQEQTMIPQSICFIGEEEDVEDIERNIIKSLRSTHISDFLRQNIPSGSSEECHSPKIVSHDLNEHSINLTYRLPISSHAALNAKTFEDPKNEKSNEQGFYVSFNDDNPKRPKPPLRVKRSLKKDPSIDDKYDSASLSNNFSNIILENDIKNDINSATYNKYNDQKINLSQLSAIESKKDQKTHQKLNPDSKSLTLIENTNKNKIQNKAIVIGDSDIIFDKESIEEMERRKEKIMLLSLQRRQQQEEAKARKEIEITLQRERHQQKEEEKIRKKEEQMARRAAILEKHRLKKAVEEAEKEGKSLDRTDSITKHISHNMFTPRQRHKKIIKPRPKTIHVDDSSVDVSESSSVSNLSKKNSNTNLVGFGLSNTNANKRDYYRGSQDSLSLKESPDEYLSTSSTPIGRMGSYKTSRDSGLGRSTPPRRAPSPGMTSSSRHMTSPSGPGSLPPGIITKRRPYEDECSLIEYSGPKLYKQPTSKSNRMIILNAVEYCVFPGAVNRESKQKVLEKIARSDSKHLLILFRDAGCQFRALYSYTPELEQVYKLYGTGPSQVDEFMFDKFFKYNSGTKCFSQVHTKHITVTIDAFTIHNSLWQGKKVQLLSKKDMALVI